MHRSVENRRNLCGGVLRVLATGVLIVSAIAPALAQSGVDPGEIQPAPPSIGADVPLVYFGAAPSTVNPSFVGPHQLLTAGKVDLDAGTVTLPLYQGRMKSGETVWYILTDTNDLGNSQQ